ncbi:MAG TPA: DUF1343 domain-containing protein [Gemmatimonadales bacterium]|nr:DUF1343 domain-containing protein [Gemmatimonadales bacterium]
MLLTDSIHLVEGRRIGLITNQTGIDASGVSTIDRLAHARGVRLVALFAPEHGIRGEAAPGERVSDSVDAATGLPIYSLYGASRAPTAAQLARLDVLLVDLQDVGARPYTYVSTMVLALRAAAAAHRRVVVLDRPNPLGGCVVQGPILDTVYASFIGMLPVPLRHGLTMGELARFANARLQPGANLVVVPMRGWRRCDWFDRTGLTWVRPSPNLPDLEAVAWYPGTVLFEATNLSVGRGTDAPFRQVGAPWLRADAVARAMRSRYRIAVAAVRFTPREPGDGKYGGVAVPGVRLPASDRSGGNPVRVALLLLRTIAELHPGQFRADTLGLARRLGVTPGTTVTWPGDLGRFLSERAPYLLYH